jgi:uracil-DNA glycosylase
VKALGTVDLFSPDEAPRLTSWSPREWAVDPSWGAVLEPFWQGTVGRSLQARLEARLAQGATIYPPNPLRALALTPLSSVRVLILGQDPYHGPGQAHGLAFSVSPGVRVPPSLRNIFKELQRDLGQPMPLQGCLEPWAARGVLLLNTCLTVEDGRAASHAGWGWEVLTDALVHAVASTAPACAYLLWGAHAQSKASKIEVCARSHGHEALLLQSNHPSPLSAARGPQPFLGNRHFSLARDWLAARGHPLHWTL